MMGQIPDDNRMSVYIYDGPITIAKRTGGAVFCNTTSEYGIQRDGASCFDIGASGPIFLKKTSWHAHDGPFSPLFSGLFLKKNSLSFSLHGASTLAGSYWLLPAHSHTHAKPAAKQHRHTTNPRKPARIWRHESTSSYDVTTPL